MTTSVYSDQPQTWYFTFGFEHRHPRTNAPLANCYTTVYGTIDETRAHMLSIFGNKWAFQYASAERAGVERYNLTYVPCTEHTPGE